MSKRLWVAWEDDTSIRSRVLANELDARYRAYTKFSGSKNLRWLRYPVALAQTLAALLRHRPRTLFVQNPSIVLAFEAALLKPLFGYELVIDLHTPFNSPGRFTKAVADALHQFGLRHCSAIIVTNDSFKAAVSRLTSRPIFVLPDKIPELGSPSGSAQLRGRRNVLYICTYSEDEPWREVVAAGELLAPDTCLYISGRGPLKEDDLPANVIPTGYLPRAAYEELLQSVDAIMVLTTAEDNLVCGAYEGVAASKPLVLSDTSALRDLFGVGAVFTTNERTAIASTLTQTLDRIRELEPGMKELKVDMQTKWQSQWHVLLSKLESWERV